MGHQLWHPLLPRQSALLSTSKSNSVSNVLPLFIITEHSYQISYNFLFFIISPALMFTKFIVYLHLFFQKATVSKVRCVLKKYEKQMS